MLEELRKCLKNKNDKTIFDILVYGSSVKGKDKPNDLDILVIFRRGNLKERLLKIQEIKNDFKSINKKIDIKGILLEELFDANFFGRSGVFIEGISLIDEKKFSEKINFSGFSLFVYSLKEKSHTEKVKFNYILSGRNSKGIIELFNGLHIAPGVIQIPIVKSLEFEEILKKNNVVFEKKNILVER